MASNDPIVEFLQAMPPAANAAAPDLRAGGATPAESVPVYVFPDAVDTYMDYLCRLSLKYAGNGLSFKVRGTSTATSGNFRVGMAIRTWDSAEDIDAAHSYDFNYINLAAAAADGRPAEGTITFADGTDMDSLAAGGLFILRLHRDGDDAGNDTATASLLLVPVFGDEA